MAAIQKKNHNSITNKMKITTTTTYRADQLTREPSNISNYEGYHGGEAASVPFTWESEPGTPKVKLRDATLPPLTPPPSYSCGNSNNNKRSAMKAHKKNSSNKSSSLFYAIFPKRVTASRKARVPPSPANYSSASLSSSPSSSSSSSPVRLGSRSVPASPMRCPRKLDRDGGYHDEEEEDLYEAPAVSGLCFGNARSRGCYSSMIKKRKSFLLTTTTPPLRSGQSRGMLGCPETERAGEIAKNTTETAAAASCQMGRRHFYGPAASGTTLNTVTPCAACKLLRRRCAEECPFSPYFSPHEPQKFAAVHKVFGASNVSKMLMEVPEGQRADAANSLVYEANLRLRDPVYGCMGAISALQQQVQTLQAEVNAIRAEILKYKYREAASQIISSHGGVLVSSVEDPNISEEASSFCSCIWLLAIDMQTL
ncbi:LOB domain-containing protein 13 isoform X1 [Senna tora]|uniref:LOB domain-containing protein 13 isoform X1 n=1 Tax=Senna tora TaxID=362788 RepID=A0A834WCP0_9FABA|nr:LOB domain-containing protein 13 isoform X1 [Senna tora]